MPYLRETSEILFIVKELSAGASAGRINSRRYQGTEAFSSSL